MFGMFRVGHGRSELPDLRCVMMVENKNNVFRSFEPNPKEASNGDDRWTAPRLCVSVPLRAPQGPHGKVQSPISTPIAPI